MLCSSWKEGWFQIIRFRRCWLNEPLIRLWLQSTFLVTRAKNIYIYIPYIYLPTYLHMYHEYNDSTAAHQTSAGISSSWVKFFNRRRKVALWHSCHCPSVTCQVCVRCLDNRRLFEILGTCYKYMQKSTMQWWICRPGHSRISNGIKKKKKEKKVEKSVDSIGIAAIWGFSSRRQNKSAGMFRID